MGEARTCSCTTSIGGCASWGRRRTSTGHVSCSFLALVLVDELNRRLQARGWKMEWKVIRQDMAALMEVEVKQGHEW